jgi:predicted Fe-Mo cluster-binding NifX family protein
MIIAVASDNGNVSAHFGHCETFEIFETDGETILKHKTVPNPGHRPGFLPNHLNNLGVNVIVSGGMGGAAVAIFNENNIEVVIGQKGSSLKAAGMYLAGELVSTGSVCHEHSHSDDCH